MRKTQIALGLLTGLSLVSTSSTAADYMGIQPGMNIQPVKGGGGGGSWGGGGGRGGSHSGGGSFSRPSPGGSSGSFMRAPSGNWGGGKSMPKSFSGPKGSFSGPKGDYKAYKWTPSHKNGNFSTLKPNKPWVDYGKYKDGKKHHHHHRRYYYYPYFFDYGYDYGYDYDDYYEGYYSGCNYYRHRWLVTHNRYWLRRYYNCLGY